MNKCPLTYQPCLGDYSEDGLRKLSPKLKMLEPLALSSEELRLEAMQRADQISIQGVQAKLSARLDPARKQFTIVDAKGRFILKPQAIWPELPQNEDLSMRLASLCGIEVPLHGMIYASDRSLVYFIQRFDRIGRSNKLPLEDFAQLTGQTRETKYNFSMERLVSVLDSYCTFPVIDKQKLFQRTIFNYLIGNEDMHLKNFSLLTRDGIVALAPAYDFLNSSIVLRNPEEIALSLNGKRRNLTRRMLIDYWGRERLGLSNAAIDDVMHKFVKIIPQWFTWIENSFLSELMCKRYIQLIEGRRATLSI